MIVHTMSAQEIARDAVQDIRAISNKITPFAKQGERTVRISRGKGQFFEQVIGWTSPRGNNWVFFLRSFKHRSTVTSTVWSRGDDHLLRAMTVDLVGNASHRYYTAHVFQRYGQRFDPTTEPVQRMLHFFTYNSSSPVHCTEDLGDGRHKVIGGIEHGLLTGVADTKERLVTFTTFLNWGQLYKEQLELAEMLDARRTFDQLTPGQQADLLRRIVAAEARERGDQQAA